MADATMAVSAPHKGVDYRAVWRWHFYAGIFCVPFVLWLAITGTVFLFSPKIEAWQDSRYDHLLNGTRHSINDEVEAAIAAVPGSTLDSYQLPHTPTSAAQVLVDKGDQQYRVYIHPQTLAVLQVTNEDHRLENFVSRLHGELLIGNVGSWIVELAACWAVVLVLTGLYLWWPRHASGLAGVLYPRLRAGGRTFWRDVHAVTGIYVSVFALFLLFTGLPWAKAWGGYLKALRHMGATHVSQQDWITSTDQLKQQRLARSNGAMANMPGMNMSSAEHAQHMKFGHHASAVSGPDAYRIMDTLAGNVAPLHLAEPVLITPPSHAGGAWSARSDTLDRPLRVDVTLDAKTGAVLSQKGFGSKPLIDRMVGTGIAAHEGVLFGWPNLLLSLFTTAGLVALSLSGLLMWWKRRPEGVLGAPAALRPMRFTAAFVVLLIALGLYFPFLGGSMILLLLVERFVLRRVAVTREWLGLRPA